jgi:hypothetical protein
MKNKHVLILSVIASLMLACNLGSIISTEQPTPIVVVVTQLVPVNTPVAQPVMTDAPSALPSAVPSTPTSAASPTASLPMVTPLKDPVNCRFGPSVNFEQVMALGVDEFAQVTGKSADGNWWQVQGQSGNYQNCWVADSVVVTSGDLSGILTVSAPAALITDVKFQISPDSINLGSSCSSSSSNFSLKGVIYVNGPLAVKWHIETQQDGSQSEHTIKFSKYGFQNISFDYMPSSWKKGSFWVRLVISSPENRFSEVTYQIKCN